MVLRCSSRGNAARSSSASRGCLSSAKNMLPVHQVESKVFESGRNSDLKQFAGDLFRFGWILASYLGVVGIVTVITKVQYERMAELRYSLRKFFRFSEEAAIAVGSTPQQYQALLAIKGSAGKDRVTIGELAEQLQIRHHSAVGLANRLAAEGFVRRIADTEDRRQVFISLTRRGESLLLKLARIHHDQWRQIAPHLESLLAKIREQKETTGATERKQRRRKD